MEEHGFAFEDFSTEIGEIEIKKVRQFDRMWTTGPGGSLGQKLLVHKDRVYFGSSNKNVYAIDARTGAEIWKYRTDGFVLLSSPVEWNGRIYVGSYDRNLYCLEAETGRLVWKYQTQGELACLPFISKGVVFFGSRDENLYAVNADDGSLKWKFKTMDQIVAATCVHDGKVFVGSFDRNMYCIDEESGRLMWKHETQGEIFNANPPAVKDGIVYFGSFDSILRAVDISTGRLVWKRQLGQYGLDECPVLHGDRMYIGTRDGYMACLTMEGKPVWKFRVSAESDITCATIYKERLYAGSGDFNMYCISPEGRMLWKFHTRGAVWFLPAAFENRIYFPSWDCFLYCVDADTGKLIFKFRSAGSPSRLAPAHEIFEVSYKIPESDFDEDRKKTYDLTFEREDELNTSTYKSEITYQMGTAYIKKGKYQVDEKTEGL